ncbi:MAG TPA: AAA family ATPase, partial [Schlesneria sp.]
MHLMKYGCFTDVQMDFTRQHSRFHLIYGNNEAGKSTALRAVSGLLYGIAPQTSDAFQHEMKDLRIAAELEASDGTRNSFVRRKGLRDTLLDVDGKPLPDNSLVKFLGGTAVEIFSSMFRLDHPSLVRGGGELLEGKGQLAESLFQAGTGITRLRRVMAELEDEANKLFKVRSQKSLVNAAVDAYTEIKDRSRTLCVIPSQWVELGRSLASKEEQLSGLKMKLSDLREKKERLNRFRLAIPHVDRRKEILTLLEALNAVQLPGTSARDRETAQRREEEALQRRERANVELTKFNSELSTSLHQPEFLAQAASINNAYERVDSYRQAIRDLPKVQAEQKHFEADAGRLLNQIQPGRSLSDSNTPTISIAQRTRIRTLAKKHLILQERIQTAASRAMSTENELKATQATFSTASVPKEATPLRQSLERVRKRGDLDVALRETLRSSTAAQELAKAELSRLTLYAGTLDDLEQLKVPSLETIDVVEAEFAALNQQKQILATQKKENDQRAEKLATEINAHQLAGEVPTETELSKSRERRQQGWLLVRAAWLDLTCTPQQIASYDPEAPLPEAYERSVLTADAIADRLRRESDRVARLGGLMADLDACQRRHAEIAAEQFELASRIKVQEDRWCASWKPANISPSSPKEMRAWLTAQRSVIARATEFRSSQRLVTELQSDVAINTTDIRQALKEYPSCNVPEGGTLSALIEIGDQHVAHLAESSKVFDKLRDENIRLEREHAKTTLELSIARGELNKWCVDWENAIAPLTLGTDTQADEALAVLEALEALAAKQGESAALQTRIGDMTTHINSFSADVTRLIKVSEAPLDALTLDDALVHLHDLLTIAQNDAVRRQTVESQIKVESQSLEIAEAQILDARRTLQGLM